DRVEADACGHATLDPARELARLLEPARGQRDVRAARVAVLRVPQRLAVAHEVDRRHRASDSRAGPDAPSSARTCATCGASARNALPRWLIAFFSAGVSSAHVRCSPSGTSTGS